MATDPTDAGYGDDDPAEDRVDGSRAGPDDGADDDAYDDTPPTPEEHAANIRAAFSRTAAAVLNSPYFFGPAAGDAGPPGETRLDERRVLADALTADPPPGRWEDLPAPAGDVWAKAWPATSAALERADADAGDGERERMWGDDLGYSLPGDRGDRPADDGDDEPDLDPGAPDGTVLGVATGESWEPRG